MAARDFIKAEVAACNIALHAAQLANAICDAKHASAGPFNRGADVYFEALRGDIADIRCLLAAIEAALPDAAAPAQEEAA